MCEIGNQNKWNKRICRWIATVLTVALLVNQSGFSVLAKEISESDVTVESETVSEQEESEEASEQEDGTQETVPQEPALSETEVPVVSENDENIKQGTEDFNLENAGSEYETGEDAKTADTATEDIATETTETEDISTITESAAEAETVATADEAVAAGQEELQMALLAGVPKIILTADIYLTDTMTVPASADIVLDGQGFSLCRGADENGAFIGTMLYLNGAEGTSGSLTLTNVCVDGQNDSTGNRVGSSAIIDYGSLILDEGAVVKGNYNYGTYRSQEDGAIILDYGGGIQVYGDLSVTERALVSRNFADEFGGGVYLADGAKLYLLADVIKGNTVADGSGYGADLYASNGSTIFYYSADIDMAQEGFYICAGANLVELGEPTAYADVAEDSKVEVYINISESSGYTQEQIEEFTRKLEDKGYKVLANRTNIDTTDLRDWYVYDHYDPNAWAALGSTWADEYGGNDKRGEYEYQERCYNLKGGPQDYYSNVTDPVYTIADWLKPEQQNAYASSPYYGNAITLAQFKEHIYTRNENGYPKMTFAGYGTPAYTDFLFYDPVSDGEKVVNFDVDSSQVLTHTLEGSGFLVNTGVDESGKLNGYLVYYTYEDKAINTETPTETKVQAISLKIYKLVDVDALSLHNTSIQTNRTALLGAQIAETNNFEWDDHMSIQIKATPSKIEIRQQPASVTTDINKSDFKLECDLTTAGGSMYSGFGPLVAYKSHSCVRASSFTYSNLRMYFTNPPGDMLDPLGKADFTQEDTQKYFINLFGNSDSKYNYTAGMGQYENFLKIMQKEGIALITDRNAPFEEYLGDSSAPDSNLCEITKEGDDILSVDALIAQISSYIDAKNTTKMQDKLQPEGSLIEVSPNQSVGNIWLQSVSSGHQIRTVNGDSIGDEGFKIRIMDDITHYYNSESTAKYYVLKPNGDIENLESSLIAVGKDSKEWPAGEYIVQQKINDASVDGYAYFELLRSDPEIVTGHSVTIKARKDGSDWDNSGKTFTLASHNVEPITFISSYNNVPNGVYSVYDTTGATDVSAYENTGATVTVNGENAVATVDYYTVIFYDSTTAYEDASAQAKQIILTGKKASKPADPTKEGYTFNDWVTENNGTTTFDFSRAINSPTAVYANWLLNTYSVTINVQKDNGGWDNHGKTFCLKQEDAEPSMIDFTTAGAGSYMLYADEPADAWITDFSALASGAYDVYEITGTAESPVYENTGITVTVTNADATTTVDYYTVTFYNGDTVFGNQIVRKNAKVSAPSTAPEKDGFDFYRWGITDDGGMEYNFENPITDTTNIYASWLAVAEKTYTITASAGTGGKVAPSGEIIVKERNSQQFTITADDGYEITSILVDNHEVLSNGQIVYASSLADSSEALSREQILYYANVKNTDADSDAKTYVFENVTDNHTLTASFKAVEKKRKGGSGTHTGGGDSSAPSINYDTSVIINDDIITDDNIIVDDTTLPVTKDSEPKTGDRSPVKIYATIGMIAGLSYLLLYFADGTSGMTEEEKKEIVGALVKWAKKGKRFRKYAALAIIFVILVYYHSIGKRTSVEWKEIYEE